MRFIAQLCFLSRDAWLILVLIGSVHGQSLLEMEQDAELAKQGFGTDGKILRCTYFVSGFSLGVENGAYLQSIMISDNQPAMTHLRMATWLFYRAGRWNIGFLSEKDLRTGPGVRARQVVGTAQISFGPATWEENTAVFSEKPEWRQVEIMIAPCEGRTEFVDGDCVDQHRERHVGQVDSCGDCLPGFAGEPVPSGKMCNVSGTAGVSESGDEQECLRLKPSGFSYQLWINERIFYLQQLRFPSGAVYKTRSFGSGEGSLEGLLYFCPSMDAWHIAAVRPKTKMASGGSSIEGYDMVRWDEKCSMKHLNCERIDNIEKGMSQWKLNHKFVANPNVTCFEEASLKACADACEKKLECLSFQYIPWDTREGERDPYYFCILYDHRSTITKAIRKDDEYMEDFEKRVAVLRVCEETGHGVYNKMAWIRNGGFEQVPFGDESKHIAGIHLSLRGISSWKTYGRIYIGSNSGGLLSSNQGNFHLWMTNSADYVEQIIYVPTEYRHVILFSAAREEGNMARIAVEVNNVRILDVVPDSNGFMTYTASFGPEDVNPPVLEDTGDSMGNATNTTYSNGTSTNITVATNGTLNATAANGTLNATATNGTLNAPATNGTLNATASNGTLNATAANGTLNATATNGTLNATATNGTLNATATNGTLNATASNSTATGGNGTANATAVNNTVNEIAGNGITNATANNGTTNATANNGPTNATVGNDTSTPESDGQENILPLGMVRIRFIHTGTGAGNLLLDHISISSEDGTIGGHFDSIANGECPFFARSSVRHPTYATNYFEANRTDLWMREQRTDDGESMAAELTEAEYLLAFPPTKLHAATELTMECAVAEEIRYAQGVCELSTLLKESCLPLLIAWAAVALSALCCCMCGCYCFCKSRTMTEEDAAVNVKIGHLDIKDERCPPEMRAKNQLQMLNVKQFGSAHPDHTVLKWELERMKDESLTRRQAKNTPSRKAGSLLRLARNIGRGFIGIAQGPERETEVTTVATRPILARHPVRHSARKILQLESTRTSQRYETQVAIARVEHVLDLSPKLDPYRQLKTTYRTPRHKRAAALGKDPGHLLAEHLEAIGSSSVRWVSPISIDFKDRRVLTGIHDYKLAEPIQYPFSVFVPRFLSHDKGSCMLEAAGFQYHVNYGPPAQAKGMLPWRLFTNPIITVHKDATFIGEVSKPSDSGASMQEFLQGDMWRAKLQKPAYCCRDEVCKLMFVYDTGQSVPAKNNVRVETVTFFDGDDCIRGRAKMEYRKTGLWSWTPVSAVLNMSACNDHETEVLLAFGLVITMAYQRFPRLRGV